MPVIGNSGVGDLDAILSPDRNCSVVVPDFEPETLRAALLRIMDARPEDRQRIRDRSRAYSLEAGVEAYASIYRRFVPEIERAEARVAC